MKKTIGITGGSGFLGRHLTELLLAEGHDVVIFTRHPSHKKKKDGYKHAFWNPTQRKCDMRFFKELDAVVHLAGAGIADKPWTPKRKREIVDSRVESTNYLVQQLKEHAPRCKTLISASAIGYYGPDRTDAKVPFQEDAPPYSDFLAQTCAKWEAASEPATSFLRRVVFRFGIILGKERGAFSALARPQKFGIVPILGNGRQMVSWVHVADVCALLVQALKADDMKGVYNAVAPQPVTHRALMNTIAREKGGIKIRIPVPAQLVKLGLGELSKEVLKSCTVSGNKITGLGYEFKYPDIDSAVRNLA
jgi:uncharacterized protein (TIGR01777 family)